MKKIKDISEDEMIAVFLQAEIDSSRWSDILLSHLTAKGQSKDILVNPDLQDEKQNKHRRDLLADFRGYGKNDHLFSHFPNHVDWGLYEMSKDELSEVMYIDYSYWNKLSKETRLPKVAVETIKEGTKIFDESNEDFLKASTVVKSGKSFPMLILVGKNQKSKLVVLEGHLRITAYHLAYEAMPEKLEVIIGYSEDMDKWDNY